MTENEMTMDSSELDVHSVDDCPILEGGTTMQIIGRFMWLAFRQYLYLIVRTFVLLLKGAVLAAIVLGIFYHPTVISGLRQGKLLDRLRQYTFAQPQSHVAPSGVERKNSEAFSPDDDQVVVEPAPASIVQGLKESEEEQFHQKFSINMHSALTTESPDPSAGIPAQDDSADAEHHRPALKSIGESSEPKETELNTDRSDAAPENKSEFSRTAAIRAISKWSRYYRVEFELALAVAKHESNLEPLRTRYEPAYYRCYILGQGGCIKINAPQAWQPMLKDESGRKMMATSWGLFQLMPDTAARIAKKEGILDEIQTIPELFRVDLNARLGIAYLKTCMDSSNTFEEVGKCYNGSQSVNWWRQVSRKYVQLLRKGPAAD